MRKHTKMVATAQQKQQREEQKQKEVVFQWFEVWSKGMENLTQAQMRWLNEITDLTISLSRTSPQMAQKLFDAWQKNIQVLLTHQKELVDAFVKAAENLPEKGKEQYVKTVDSLLSAVKESIRRIAELNSKYLRTFQEQLPEMSSQARRTFEEALTLWQKSAEQALKTLEELQKKAEPMVEKNFAEFRKAIEELWDASLKAWEHYRENMEKAWGTVRG